MQNIVRELRARRGWSQADLAARLGVSRQSVNALETGRSDPSLQTALRIAWLFGGAVEEIFAVDLEEKMTLLEEAWEFQDRTATALDEVGVLDEMGRQGWELTGFGPLVLHFRRPEKRELRVPWRYLRVTEVLSTAQRRRVEADGWTYCGSWMGTLHYFKHSGSEDGGATEVTGATGESVRGEAGPVER